MDKQNVGIFNHVAGDPVHAILKQLTARVGKDPEMQPLVYSNLAMACDDSLIPRLEKARSKFPRGSTFLQSTWSSLHLRTKLFLLVLVDSPMVNAWV